MIHFRALLPGAAVDYTHFQFSPKKNFKSPNTCYLSLIDLFDRCENAVFAREYDWK